MKKLAQHSDSIFVGSMILGLIIGAGVLWSHWQVIHDYWKTNFDKYIVSPEDIVSGGARRDTSIVPIDVPVFTHVNSLESQFRDYDPVIAINYDGIERAYPLNILAVHEIVNDSLGNVPIAVTFCPMCNSAVVYRREVDGQILRMGVSGNFYSNNFLMYDDLTESWWHQFTGEAIIGDYAGTNLEIIPSQVVSFSAFIIRYPNGNVLTGDAQYPERNYDYSPYGFDAYESSAPLLSNNDYDPRLSPMARVLSTTVDTLPIAYPFEELREAGIVNDEVNGQAVVIFWQSGPDPDTVGQAAAYGRELNGEILTFRNENGRIYDNETNSEWNIFGEAIAGDLTGEALYDYQCFTHFWFAWSTTYPNTLVYQE